MLLTTSAPKSVALKISENVFDESPNVEKFVRPRDTKVFSFVFSYFL
jgi:hypothetical protein